MSLLSFPSDDSTIGPFRMDRLVHKLGRVMFLVQRDMELGVTMEHNLRLKAFEEEVRDHMSTLDVNADELECDQCDALCHIIDGIQRGAPLSARPPPAALPSLSLF